MCSKSNKCLNPQTYYAFRDMFTHFQNMDILCNFINSILSIQGKSLIKTVFILNKMKKSDINSNKGKILDILCKSKTGKRVIVRLQLFPPRSVKKSLLSYTAASCSVQLKRQMRTNKVKRIICIAFVDFILFPFKRAYRSEHIPLDIATLENDIGDLKFIFVELPKFFKEGTLETPIEKWCYFIKHGSEITIDEIQEIYKNDVLIQKAYEEIKKQNWSIDECENQEISEKDVADIEEEVKIGAVKRMFQKGLSVEFIKDIVDFSVEKIESITDDLA